MIGDRAGHGDQIDIDADIGALLRASMAAKMSVRSFIGLCVVSHARLRRLLGIGACDQRAIGRGGNAQLSRICDTVPPRSVNHVEMAGSFLAPNGWLDASANVSARVSSRKPPWPASLDAW